MYTDIKSNYLKSKIINLPWDKHNYIEHLIKLEDFILNHPRSFMGSILFASLKSKYPKSFLAMLKELSPNDYAQYIHEVNFRKINQLRIAGVDKVAEKKSKEDWVKMGGAL